MISVSEVAMVMVGDGDGNRNRTGAVLCVDLGRARNHIPTELQHHHLGATTDRNQHVQHVRARKVCVKKQA